jgi:hypothetical protein
MKKNNSLKGHWQGKIFIICCFVFLSLPFSIPAHPRHPPQEKEHEPIVEKVTVTNVEVPVRVLFKGRPVEDLTKENFTLFEDNKNMEINGFFVKRKKIKITQPPGKVQGANNEIPPPTPSPRTFVMAFNITSYNQYFEAAMDHMFDKILKPTDHVIVFANDTTLQYRRLENMSQIKEQIIDDLKKESKKARIRLQQYINLLETYLKVSDLKRVIKQLTSESSGGSFSTLDPAWRAAQVLESLLQKYARTWNQYKKQYLIPRVDRFYYFARYLEKLKTEKFVLNFYQFEFFPKIRFGSEIMIAIRQVAVVLSNTNDPVLVSRGHTINNLLNQLQTDYDLNKGFPNEEISKLFYKVDATFHSFFIRAHIPAVLEDFEYRTLASDLENVLKGITDITGGKNITSNDLVNSLDIVTEVEDVYYILTYAPKDPQKAGKLKIKVNNRKYKVLYDNNFRADYINDYFNSLEEKLETPEIKIGDFSFQRKILAFAVTDYLMRKRKQEDKQPVGMLKIRIRLVNRDNISMFDQEKVLTAQKNDMKISLGAFKKIKKGEYDFLIDVVDMFTGKQDNFHQKVTVR